MFRLHKISLPYRLIITMIYENKNTKYIVLSNMPLKSAGVYPNFQLTITLAVNNAKTKHPNVVRKMFLLKNVVIFLPAPENVGSFMSVRKKMIDSGVMARKTIADSFVRKPTPSRIIAKIMSMILRLS